MSEIIIRRLTIEDVQAVERIYADVLDPSYISFSELAEGKGDGLGVLSQDAAAIFSEQIRRLWEEPTCGYFVALEDGEIAAFVLSSLHETEGGHIECWIDDIAVRARSQRKGIAKSLIEQAIQWGTAGGSKYFLLESGINNPAHALFEELGFTPLATVFWRQVSVNG